MHRAWLSPPLAAAGALGTAGPMAARAFRVRALAKRLGDAGDEGGPPPPAPEIARAFARRAAPRGAAPATVRPRQRGEMRPAPGEAWKPFTAERTVGVRAPGFVWLAWAAPPPLPVRVLDAHADGANRSEARPSGAAPVARAMGPELDRGELMRDPAELAWAPRAVLHNPHPRRRHLDAAAVEVPAPSAGGPARVRPVFEGGDLARVEADDRPAPSAAAPSRPPGAGVSATVARGAARAPRPMRRCHTGPLKF